MRKLFYVSAILSTLTLMGCSGAFWGGTGAGVLGAGAGYEIQAQRQMNILDDDLKNGRISQHDYDIRKDQIQKGSLLK